LRFASPAAYSLPAIFFPKTEWKSAKTGLFCTIALDFSALKGYTVLTLI